MFMDTSMGDRVNPPDIVACCCSMIHAYTYEPVWPSCWPVTCGYLNTFTVLPFVISNKSQMFSMAQWLTHRLDHVDSRFCNSWLC